MTSKTEYKSSSIEEIQAKMLSLNENKFSEKILVPLFREIYSAKVDFTGGVTEKGKDFVIQKEDELGDLTVIAVQVKKVKYTANSNIDSFQSLLTQLNQAVLEPIVLDTGVEHFPNIIMVITPHFIKPNILDTHKYAYKEALKKDIRILDGQKIISLIKRHKPCLINDLLGHEFSIAEDIYKRLDNKQLMEAMGLTNKRRIKSFYCQASVYIGNSKLINYFNNKIDSRSEVGSSIKLNDINVITNLASEIYRVQRLEIFLEPKLDEITNFDKNNLIESIKKVRKKLHAFIKEIQSNSLLETNRIENQLNQEIKLKSVLETYDKDKNLKNLYKDIVILFSQNKFDALPSVISQTFTDMKTTLIECSDLQALIEGNSLSVTVNLKGLTQFIETEKKTLATLNCDSTKNISLYIEKNEFLMTCIRQLDYFNSEIVFKDNDQEKQSKKIILDHVFETRRNVAVLGDAGSGKTTSLKMYASKLLDQNVDNNARFVIFSTLSEICLCSQEQHSQNLLDGIHQFYKKKLISISLRQLKDTFIKGNATVILDSVDEAIAEYSWVIEAIISFNKNFPNTQIIISSRLSIKKINEIPFSHVSLLPFNDKQKLEFFKKWFESEEEALILNKHLIDNPTLSEIVVNPLSLTILCILKENDIPLPNSETALYEQRFNLLAGKFDTVKKIKRIKSQPEQLITITKIIALEMHKQKIRFFSKEKILEPIYTFINNKLASNCPEEVIEDLIKSEIIVLQLNGSYSFGHLRFQEYLSAEELTRDRDFDTSRLLNDSWWKDVLLLYAKIAKNIFWIINYAKRNGIVSKHKSLLFAIISERPEEKQEQLFIEIRAAIADELDDPYKIMSIDSSEYLEDLTHPLDK